MPDDETVRCLCSGERLDPELAHRLGCDMSGGCPELREAMEPPDA
jgi:hypothetical protein